MSSEYDLRLQDIRRGPWHDQAELARDRCRQLSDDEAKRLFRSHYQEGIYDQDEIDFRESFDQALEELQLLELAVVSGYLPLAVVSDAATTEMEMLLRSAAARAYVVTYDFVPVRFLAARLGLDFGWASVQPPHVDPLAGLRYATFLAVHSDFIASEPISVFTMLMDDYLFSETVNAAFFKAYLAETGKRPDGALQPTLDELRTGLVQFIQMLGDLFLQLRDAERALYGCVYGYWLSHFFGIRRTEGGYEQLGVSFGDVARSPLLLATSVDREVARAEQLRIADRVAMLRDVWTATRNLIESLA